MKAWALAVIFNIGSGNGLVPSGNKPLHEPMLAKFYVTICHMASQGHNGLIEIYFQRGKQDDINFNIYTKLPMAEVFK